VDQVVAALRAAARPMIVAGNGVQQSGGSEELRLLAERLGVPVVTSLGGKGAIPETHELSIGAVGRYSRNYANAALSEADVILAVGTALGGLVTDGYKLIKPGTELYHVSIDSNVLGSHFPTRLGLLADARTFLSMALEACDRSNGHSSNGHNGNGHHGNGHDTPYRATSPWMAELSERRDAWRGVRAELGLRDGTDGRPMRPEAVMPIVDELMADDAIVVADTGYASAWAGALLELRTAGRNFLRADGSLGWAFPGSLGAQMAAPEKQVICVIGDGGFGYNVTEIETMVRMNLPVTVVILNNQTLAFELHVQDLLLNHPVNEVDDFLDVDYGAVARAFGANGTRVTTAPDFRQALASSFEGRGPSVIDVVIDRDAIPPATRYDAVRTREL
jgi:acetolactate synthase-1/2/3 large subunit